MSDLLTGIANLTKSVSNTLNSYEMRKIGDKVQGYVLNFTDAEAKVRDATNEDPWGPTGPQMLEIAGLTFQYDVFPEIMGMLWKRMFQENKAAWRRVYKSLILLNYLLKNGSERVISTARDHTFELRALESYKCFDERGKDEGINVRHRAKLVLELLQDDEMLRVERRKAKTEGREKYQGFSKDEMMYKGKVSSFESWNAPSRNEFSKTNDFSSNHGNGNQREITAFDFAESRNHSGSPELGIPDRSQHNNTDDFDDEFGEFSEARSTAAAVHSPPPPSPSNNSTISVKIPSPQSRTAAIPKPGLTPPAAQQHNKSNIDDLFSLADNNGTTSSRQPGDNNNSLFDFMPSNIAQPSTTINSGNALDDIFGAPTSGGLPTPAHPPQPAAVNTNLVGNMDLFAQSNSTSFNAGSNQSFFSSPSSMRANLFSNTTGSAVTTPTAGGNILDMFSAPPSIPTSSSLNNMTSNSLLSDLDFSNLTPITATASVIAKNMTSTSTGGAQQQQTSSSSSSSTPSKLPKTWEDLKGKVDLDFDNLSLRPQPAKHNPSLNELQEKKGATTAVKNNNPLW